MYSNSVGCCWCSLVHARLKKNPRKISFHLIRFPSTSSIHLNRTVACCRLYLSPLILHEARAAAAATAFFFLMSRPEDSSLTTQSKERHSEPLIRRKKKGEKKSCHKLACFPTELKINIEAGASEFHSAEEQRLEQEQRDGGGAGR